MAANGAQYGVATVHYYWIGAVPAMVFLGVVMMPFYYRSKVRSVPEFLRVRFNDSTHVLNAGVFALSAVLIAGVNLYALAIVLQSLLGVNLYVGIVVSAAFVLVYIGAGGLVQRHLRRGPAVLRHPGRAHPADHRRGRARGRLQRPRQQGDQRVQGQRQRPARLGRHRHRRAHPQPDRRRLHRHRARAGLRAVVRLLDDELRRGAARAVGQGRVGHAPHADHRRLPEAADPGRHDHSRPGRRSSVDSNSATAART